MQEAQVSMAARCASDKSEYSLSSVWFLIAKEEEDDDFLFVLFSFVDGRFDKSLSRNAKST